MSDPNLQPSPEADAILTKAGWYPERTAVGRKGNAVFPLAEAVLRQSGGLRFQHSGLGGPSGQDFDVDPSLWYGMRDEVEALSGDHVVEGGVP
jgi:hypothetical protein